MSFGVFIKEPAARRISDASSGFDALVKEEVVLYREVFVNGIVKPEITKGILCKDCDNFFVQNGADKIYLQDGDKIIFSGWEKIFRKNV
ncbi:MAG: hypothetical protein HZB67_05230 [Candidatus Aenigmarchaeota archaeon]|nr:hypothetical protein [Candidatus Aenigmarchaeota archaeon]